jgi:hypothetical protein
MRTMNHYSIRLSRLFHQGLSSRQLVLGAAVIATTTLALSSAQAAEVDVRLVALSGQPAPGTEEGTTFWLFTNGLNHSMMHPVIDADGHVAFVARVTGPNMDDAQMNGLWIERDGVLELVARSGTPAPGIGGDVMLQGFPSHYLPMPPLVAGGKLAFNAELSGPGTVFGNNQAMYKESDDGELEFLGRHGDAAAGLSEGFVYGTRVFVSGFNADGHVMLTGDVYGPGSTDDDDEAIWTDRDGALTTIVREGDPAPGLPGIVFGRGDIGSSQYALPQASFNGASQILFQGNLAGENIDYYNDEALWIEDAGVITTLLREGDPAPGAGNGVTFGGGSVSLSVYYPEFNDQGESAFTIRLGGAIPTTTVLYSTHGGSLHPVLLPGDTLTESYLANPTLNDASALAFRSALPDDDSDPFTQPPWELWSDQTGTPALIATPGQAIVNAPGYTLESVGIMLGFNTSGQVAMQAPVLDGDGVLHYSSLLLSDDNGALHKVVAVGEMFDVQGDGSDMREIIRIVTGGLSETGHVVFRLDFTTDGLESGHFVASLEDLTLACPADMVNSDQFQPPGDGVVDGADLAFMLGAWGRNPGSSADIVSSATFAPPPDGIVDGADLATLLGAWGTCD